MLSRNLLERKLPFIFIMKGMSVSLKEASMSTTLAVTQQQSIELVNPRWTSIHNPDRCPRCSGLMVAEWCQDLSDYSARRCVQCGEVIDPVILQNRLLYGRILDPGKGPEQTP